MNDSLEQSIEVTQAIRAEIGRAVLGQQAVIDQVLVALLAAGHVMIEGLPGLGKTLLVKAMAKTFSGASARIQFTPDLMPSDITGHVMYDLQSGQFQTREGPVFTNLLLADEINRAPAKTQAAMLEVMQEHQVTIDGEARPLPSPFMTLATQNPLEHEGTYPLPDAQLDRFLLKLHIEYPERVDEVRIVQQITGATVGDSLDTRAVQTVTDGPAIESIQRATAQVRVDERVVSYAVDIVRTTRAWPGVATGAGPRGGLALVRAARGHAVLQGHDHVTPDDVKAVAHPALRHRIVLSPEAEIEGQIADRIVDEVLRSVDAPRA